MSSKRVLSVRCPEDSVPAQTLRAGIARIQDEVSVSPAFPAAVEAAAERVAAAVPESGPDRTDIELVTIDPDGARDLDQALHVARDGDGYVVHYAIADVAAFVQPGDDIDQEAHRRGETLYGADSKVPLHPTALSEDAASLLPDRTRPALLWTITLAADGSQTSASVTRAMVRSRAQLSYEQAQEAIDSGNADESLALLREVGQLRMEQEVARGGVSLPLPEQELVADGDHWHLEFRRLLPVEEWNAQISLLTGMVAAGLMLEAGVGVLRTLPPADPRDIKRLRRTAHALGIEWGRDVDYPELIRSLDPAEPHHAAMVVASTRLLRGSGYAAFDGTLPEQVEHSAVAAPYAHVTAPLRRLVDRYALEVCVALSAGEPVPAWVREALPGLPDTMRESGRRASQYESAVVNLCEALLLADNVGDTFDGVVVEADEKDETRGEVTIQDPAIEAVVRGDRALPVGQDVVVELVDADPATRSVEFRLV
ncbi:MAG: RNB domain-containing ribonuclease [Nocardioides sp.]|nr:RNB domain-containing ribonuclease [Nocardioides sp.]